VTLRAVAAHLILIAGAGFLLTPVALILFSSPHETATLLRDGLQLSPGGRTGPNYTQILTMGAGFTDGITALSMLKNSLIVGLGVAALTTIFSLLTAYALLFFRVRWAGFAFWLVFATLLFPLESRMIATFQVTADLGLINSHAGMVLPVLAAALGTFFFQQFFLTLPEEYAEAAVLDGAGPIRFLLDIVVPLAWPRAGAIFVISFMIGWNQYLWPLMISTDEGLYTLVRGIRLIGQESGPGMALIVISILPPFVMLLAFQRWFFQALADETR
jgi:sn-glycerol 3-phosphate transport system permease protein